ncbi:MAG TPA: hypothetical protein VIM61_02345 [Chthoniobacterales bacterium]
MTTSASKSKERKPHRISIELEVDEFEQIDRIYGQGYRSANIIDALLNPATARGTAAYQNKARILERVLNALNELGKRVASADITDETALKVLCELRSLRKELLKP